MSLIMLWLLLLSECDMNKSYCSCVYICLCNVVVYINLVKFLKCYFWYLVILYIFISVTPVAIYVKYAVIRVLRFDGSLNL